MENEKRFLSELVRLADKYADVKNELTKFCDSPDYDYIRFDELRKNSSELEYLIIFNVMRLFDYKVSDFSDVMWFKEK